MNPEMLLSFLRENGIIDDVQMSDLQDEQSRSGKNIEEVVANSGVIRLTDLYQRKEYADPLIGRTIVGYLRVCPQPAAARIYQRR